MEAGSGHLFAARQARGGGWSQFTDEQEDALVCGAQSSFASKLLRQRENDEYSTRQQY